MLDRGARYDTRFYQYRNALKNYFNRDSVAITQVSADLACDYLVKYYDSYDPDDVMKEKKFFDDFLYVLMYLGVRVIYDRANSTADLIGTDGSVVMADLDLIQLEGGGRTVALNPIKNTGTNESVWLWCTAGILVLSIGAVSFVLIKRKGREEVNGD